MQKLLAYPLTVLYLIFFGLCLLIFHPVQWLCFNVFGYGPHRASVAVLNLCLMRCTHILGTSYTFDNPNNIPTDRPLIIVPNHQSMHDIPPIIWFMRKHHPKFVSKKELGKGIPSVSYNLRHGGSVLIDRNNSKQPLLEIAKLGRYIATHNRSAVIFPEGTRSSTGHPKPFKATGLKLLMKNAPSALVVPISIDNSWKMLRYGKFPNGIGNHITFKVHKPIEIKENLDAVLVETEKSGSIGPNFFSITDMSDAEIVEQTIAFVKETLQGAEGGHDWFHIQRVFKNTLLIAKDEKVDVLVVSLGALLHDIADAKFNEGDEEIGPELASSFLNELQIKKKTVQHVVKIIENISFKNTFEKRRGRPFQSKELQVVQDADSLDAMGAIGIARAFNYGGFKNRELYNPEIAPNLKMTKEAYKKSTAPTINHFYEKLLLLKDKMHTKTGKKLAEERHKYMLDYLKQFYREWDPLAPATGSASSH